MQPDWWKYVVDIAQILSAIGTCGAVVVALWVALRSPTLHISGLVGIRVVVQKGVRNFPRYVQIAVTNNGEREFVITGLTWVPMARSDLHAIQTGGVSDENVWSESVPKKLAFGESASYFLAMEGERDWFESIGTSPEVWLKAYSRRESLKKLRLYVSTSVGITHKIKPEEPFLDRLWIEIEKAIKVQEAAPKPSRQEDSQPPQLLVNNGKPSPQ